MSQRLLIALKKNVTSKDDFYDAIYTEEGTMKTLMIDWSSYDCTDGFYIGPWKITIRDWDIFDQFMGDFVQMKRYIPELQSLKDCWVVYDERRDKTYRNEEIDKDMGTIAQAVMKENDRKRKEERDN